MNKEEEKCTNDIHESTSSRCTSLAETGAQRTNHRHNNKTKKLPTIKHVCVDICDQPNRTRFSRLVHGARTACSSIFSHRARSDLSIKAIAVVDQKEAWKQHEQQSRSTCDAQQLLWSSAVVRDDGKQQREETVSYWACHGALRSIGAIDRCSIDARDRAHNISARTTVANNTPVTIAAAIRKTRFMCAIGV